MYLFELVEEAKKCLKDGTQTFNVGSKETIHTTAIVLMELLQFKDVVFITSDIRTMGFIVGVFANTLDRTGIRNNVTICLDKIRYTSSGRSGCISFFAASVTTRDVFRGRTIDKLFYV